MVFRWNPWIPHLLPQESVKTVSDYSTLPQAEFDLKFVLLKAHVGLHVEKTMKESSKKFLVRTAKE